MIAKCEYCPADFTLGEGARLPIIVAVIAYLKGCHPDLVVTPFETVMEGDYDDLMATLKGAIELAGRDCDNIFANVKIHYRRILTIDEKWPNILERHISLLTILACSWSGSWLDIWGSCPSLFYPRLGK